MCLTAMDKTKSVKAAARYLNCSYHHLKRYMKLYVDEESGKTLFDKHKNQQGKGIPKFLRASGKEPSLIDIIEGKINPASFSPEKLKYRLTVEGHLEECCGNCGFTEHRVTDHKVPLILHFKDKNKLNYNLTNIEFLCYNCYYLSVGDIFTDKQVEAIEDHKPVNTGEVSWDLDPYQLERLKELGLGDIEADDDLDIVSRL